MPSYNCSSQVYDGNTSYASSSKKSHVESRVDFHTENDEDDLMSSHSSNDNNAIILDSGSTTSSVIVDELANILKESYNARPHHDKQDDDTSTWGNSSTATSNADLGRIR